MQEAVDELLAHQIHIDETQGEEFADGGFDMLIERNARGQRPAGPTVHPEPPVTLEQWEATKELRCRFCPHPADAYARPPQLPLEEAPWTQFRCGCRVHTVCYAIHIAVQDYHRESSCPVCNAKILTDEQRLFLAGIGRDRHTENAIAKRINTLWEEDEAFHEEMREVAKEGRKVGPLYQEYLKDKLAIRQEWKAAITPSVNIIRHHKQIFTKKLKEIQTRKKYLAAQGRYKRKLFRFLNTYDVDQHALNRAILPKGMPKLRPATRWGNWREKAWSIFRVRI